MPHISKMRQVAGQAEQPNFKGGKWQNGRQKMQMQEWFGKVPDFIITLDAGYCVQVSDIGFCALLDHELYHCAQAVDEFGQPKFNDITERPVFAIRGHDVEEFVGVVRRWGIETTANGREFIEAASRQPEVAMAAAVVCGNCLK